jgi:hypothetical protein
MKRPLRLGEGMRDEQGWHATDCQPIVSRRSIRVRQIHERVKTLRILVGATGFEPATPCAQGKLERPCEVLLLEGFAASKNSWAQFWAHPSGDVALAWATDGEA